MVVLEICGPPGPECGASDGKAHWATNPESSLLGAIDGKVDGATDPEGSLLGARVLGGEPHDFVGNKQLLKHANSVDL